MNADQSIWKDQELTDYYFAEECKGFDCDPHHFPQDYGNKFHFTRDTFVEL